MNEKARIRKEVLQSRDSIEQRGKEKRDRSIENRLFSLKQFTKANRIMFFASFKSEPDTFGMISKSLDRGKEVILPKVDRQNRKLLLYNIMNISELVPGFMNIPEPVVSEERRVNPDFPDIIIMPGVAFDRKCNRLGYGGGFYDLLLSNLEMPPMLIAIAYSEQIIERVPVERHDVTMDMVVTDRELIDRRN